MEYSQHIYEISGQIAEKDTELAGIFDRILGGLAEKGLFNQTSKSKNSERSDLHNTKISDIVNILDQFGKMNIIPGEPNSPCLPFCVCCAFDKWQSNKGFRGIAGKTIAYWLSCPDVNRGTLILTFAWDDVDFYEKYKPLFDRYTNDPRHTIAVVLITNRGISLQYLSR
jgi:hypothetical protein